MKRILLLVAYSIVCLSHAQHAKRSETVPVNGTKLYYEVYGKGEPLIFLHGYSLSSTSWKPYVADFKAEYEVYLIDLTGHGKSEPFKEDLSIESVAKDLQALLSYLELDQIKAIGFSFGGDVLFQLALLEPDLVESMITIGAVGTWTVEDFPQYLEVFTFDNRDQFSWLKDSHSSDEQIKALMDQFVNYKVILSDEELRQIQPEVLIMIGDDDEGMDINEVARTRSNLPNSDLWILPNVAHGAHEGPTKEDFVVKAKAFLSKKENSR